MKHVKTDREKRIEALERKQLIKAGVIKEEKNKSIISEYLGNNIEFKMIDGNVYANETQIANAFDNGRQKLADWKRSKKTKELIDELNKINDVENSHINKKELIISEKGVGTENGTWIEENLLLDLAQYLSISFRVWCQKQIATLIREGTVVCNVGVDEILDTYQIFRDDDLKVLEQ